VLIVVGCGTCVPVSASEPETASVSATGTVDASSLLAVTRTQPSTEFLRSLGIEQSARPAAALLQDLQERQGVRRYVHRTEQGLPSAAGMRV